MSAVFAPPEFPPSAGGKPEVARDGGESSAPGRGRENNRVFVYWDNSNIYARAKTAAQREGWAARKRVRINFERLMRLACAGRAMEKAVVAGSTPPLPEAAVWRRMTGVRGVTMLTQFHRGGRRGKEQEVPDLRLQLRMMCDALDFPDSPGVAVLLTGDGKPRGGEGFFRALRRMRGAGWRVELLAWKSGCSTAMRRWAEKNGVFVPLDDYYEAVTFLEESRIPGSPAEPSRPSAKLDLSRRPTAE